MDPFEHTPVANDNAIRIAILSPGAFDEEIEITIQQASLNDQEAKYEALSYVWGTESEKYQITCNEKFFDVTKNLYCALKYLRKETEPRSLWIDAICIDQHNILERNHQVGLMRFIYSQATTVLIWPGEDVNNAQAVYDICQLGVDLMKATPDLFNQSSVDRRKTRDLLSRQKNFRKIYNGILAFLENAWFRRVWTFQEVYLSREAQIQCGKYSYPWNSFCFGWLVLETLGIKDYHSAHNSAITVIVTYMWRKEMEFNQVYPLEQRIRLSNLLRSTKHHLASDPRDKVFGLLAMVESDNHLEDYLDYNMTVEEVFIKYARLLIEDDGHLQILSDVSGTKSNFDLPSWVPCWTERKLETQELAERIRNFPLVYNLHKGFSPKLIIPRNTDPKKLQLCGSCVDNIVRFVPLRDFINEIDPIRVSPTAWKMPLLQFKIYFGLLNILPQTYVPTSEAGLSAAIRTLAAGDLPDAHRGTEETLKELFPHTHDFQNAKWEECVPLVEYDIKASVPSPHFNSPGAPVREVYDVLFARGHPTQWDDHPNMIIDRVYCMISGEILSRIRMISKERVFFITKKGYIGIGPRSLRQGDLVFDLLGGDVPYILRPSGAGNEFRILGDAYVHGIMDGELWKVAEDGSCLESIEGDLNWQDVVLV